ncbi:HTH domain-containing protein [Mammaliicoccus vitulinus]|uniref:HTH domain-containing protein n=1 Tax=Mammaliicoccus vitulinus TaxID=71237 RepID=UPI003BA0C322
MAKANEKNYAERIQNVANKYELEDKQLRKLLNLPKEKYELLLHGNQGVLTDVQRNEIGKRLNYFEAIGENKDALKYSKYYIEKTLKKEYNLTNKSIAKLCNVKKKTVKNLLNNKKIDRKEERNLILNILQLYETLKSVN